MKSLFILTAKNLKLLFRSKSSALIVVFAPLLLILVLSMAYNTSTVGLNIGVYSSAFSDDVNTFVSTLQEQDFRIITYTSSIEDCVADMKVGAVHTCILLPEQLKVEDNIAKEVTFYIDPTKINLVWMIQEVVGEKFDLKSQQLSQELAGGLISSLTETREKVGSRQSEVQQAKEKVAAASSAVGSAKSTLSGLDVVVEEKTYPADLLGQLNGMLVGTQGEVAMALETVEAANITNGKTDIVAALTAVQTSLEAAVATVNSTAAESLSGLITSLQADLVATKGKLTAAASGVSSSAAALDASVAAIQESISLLSGAHTALGSMQEKLASQRITNPSTVSAPLATKIIKVGSEGTYLNYGFPALIVLVLMFSSLLLGTTLVMMEKSSPAFFRNFFLPVRKTTFVIATYMTNLVLIIIQLIIILGISLFFLKELSAALPLIVLILFLAASVFTFLGMALGYMFRSEETGVLASISLGSLLLFLSGTILPLETVSPLLREATSYNPFVIAEKLIREVFVFNMPLEALWIDLVLLLGYAAVLFLLILMAESLLHQHLVSRMLRHQHKSVKG